METLCNILRSEGGLLDAGELAELLSLHVKTIYKLLRKGYLPGFRIDGAIRIDRREVANWLDARRNLKLA